MRLPIVVLTLLLVCSAKTADAQNADIGSFPLNPTTLAPSSSTLHPTWSPSGRPTALEFCSTRIEPVISISM